MAGKGLPVVYVSGPYSRGDWAENVRTAINAAEELRASGYAPLVPHLSALWALVHPHAWAEWVEIDLALVGRCDAVLRLPGDSCGADRETDHAGEQGIPVFCSVAELVQGLSTEQPAQAAPPQTYRVRAEAWRNVARSHERELRELANRVFALEEQQVKLSKRARGAANGVRGLRRRLDDWIGEAE